MMKRQKKLEMGETYEVVFTSNARAGEEFAFIGICRAAGTVTATFEIVAGSLHSDRDGYRGPGQNARFSLSSITWKNTADAIADLEPAAPRRQRSARLSEVLERSAQKLRDRLEQENDTPHPKAQ